MTRSGGRQDLAPQPGVRITMDTVPRQTLDQVPSPRVGLELPVRVWPATITQVRPSPRQRRTALSVRPPVWVQAWRPPGGAFGPCPEGGSHLVLICDESGSVQGADPIRYRHALLLRVLDALAPACTCGECTVRLVLFGASYAVPTTSPDISPWVRAPHELGRAFEQLPWTGSYLGPAMDQVEGATSGNAITVCLTDLALFDLDPVQHVARFAAQPNPLLLLLGPGIPPTDPRVPTIRVDDSSPRTEIADQISAHITSTRLHPRPTDRPASDSLVRRIRSHANHGGRGLRIGGLAGLAALVFLTWMLTANDRESSPAPSGVAAAAGGVPDPGPVQVPVHSEVDGVGPGSSDPFTIPGLGGDVPRTMPMAATLLIDPTLTVDPDTLERIRNELPAVLDYLQRYRIPGDTLALGDLAPSSLADLSRLKSAAAEVQPAPLPKIPEEVGSDRMVAVMTDRPGHWQAEFTGRAAGASTRAALAAGERPVRYYAIDISGTQAVPTDLPDDGPWLIPAAADRAGTVAQAIARAWGDAIGARWLG